MYRRVYAKRITLRCGYHYLRSGTARPGFSLVEMFGNGLGQGKRGILDSDLVVGEAFDEFTGEAASVPSIDLPTRLKYTSVHMAASATAFPVVPLVLFKIKK